MKIYIDEECKCHTSNPYGKFRGFDVLKFDGKCQEYIEGCRYCPEDESYVRDDGEVFSGECIVPWKPLDELDSAQHEYERQQLAEYETALSEIETALGVME